MNENPFKKITELEEEVPTNQNLPPEKLRKEIMGSYHATGSVFFALSIFTEKLLDAFSGIMHLVDVSPKPPLEEKQNPPKTN